MSILNRKLKKQRFKYQINFAIARLNKRNKYISFLTV